MTPDWGVVKALRRIDPKLSVRWVKERGVWGVFHDAPYPARLDALVRENGTQIQLELLKRGYVVTRGCAEEYAWLQIQDATLVFYVTEEDGSYRPLDNRVVEKMMRMDSFRRNFSIKDWKDFMNVKARAQKEMRERTWEDFNQQVHKDKVYKQQMAEALRGDSHLRSVGVTQPEKEPRYSLAELRQGGEQENADTECDTRSDIGEGLREAVGPVGA